MLNILEVVIFFLNGKPGKHWKVCYLTDNKIIILGIESQYRRQILKYK